MNRALLVGFAVSASVLGSAATAQDDLGDQLNQLRCESRSLTICQDDFCFVLFDQKPNEEFALLLDVDRKLYQVPGLSADWKPMDVIATEQKKQHYELRFRIELADHHPANVILNAYRRDDGSHQTTAAVRGVYPATAQ